LRPALALEERLGLGQHTSSSDSIVAQTSSSVDVQRPWSVWLTGQMIRAALLRASHSSWLRGRVARNPVARRAVLRFMPGERLEHAIAAAGRLANAGLSCVLTHLGEHASDTSDAESAADEYGRALTALIDARLATHVSVKPSQLGLVLDPRRALGLMEGLAGRAAGRGVLWLDMEDSAQTDATIDLYRRLRRTHDSVGLCLQAYLRRTPRDVALLLPLSPRIRLVKGAYREPAAAAYQDGRDVDASFVELAVTLLRRRADVGLGTHDVRLLQRIERLVRPLDVDRTAYEVQMLYGIRDDDQRRLAAAGYRMRVLIAYGSDWFAWYCRRLAERPANLLFVLGAARGSVRNGGSR
jgi:proline dehydrogenase